MTDRIYPQFATHNAHTVAAILDMAKPDPMAFEFQRLHGMGERLHDIVLTRSQGTRCRIYAPVGAHRDLLAYLVRRLSGKRCQLVSFVQPDRQSRRWPPKTVAACPVTHDGEDASRVAKPGAAAPAPQLFGVRNAPTPKAGT